MSSHDTAEYTKLSTLEEGDEKGEDLASPRPERQRTVWPISTINALIFSFAAGVAVTTFIFAFLRPDRSQGWDTEFGGYVSDTPPHILKVLTSCHGRTGSLAD
jgi:hypothetical protein